METFPSPQDRTARLLFEIDRVGLKIAKVARAAGVPLERMYRGRRLSDAEADRVVAAIVTLKGAADE